MYTNGIVEIPDHVVFTCNIEDKSRLCWSALALLYMYIYSLSPEGVAKGIIKTQVEYVRACVRACVRDNYKKENGVELCCVYNCTKSLEKMNRK